MLPFPSPLPSSPASRSSVSFLLTHASLPPPFHPFRSFPSRLPSLSPPTPSLSRPDELHHLPHQIVTKQRDLLEERRALSVLVAADLANGGEDGEVTVAAVDGEPVMLAPLESCDAEWAAKEVWWLLEE